jgi:anti-sigma factor RsiW
MTDPEGGDARLRRAIDRLRQPKGACLPDEVAIGYVLDTLTAAEQAQADDHLTRCAKCASEMAWLIEESSAWQGPEGERRLEEWRSRVGDALRARREPLQAVMRNVELPAEVFRRTPRDPGEVGPIRYHGVEDQNRNLVLRFDSDRLDLAGWSVRLTAARFTRNVVLRQVGPEAIRAEMTITHAERIRWTAQTPLTIEVVQPRSTA